MKHFILVIFTMLLINASKAQLPVTDGGAITVLTSSQGILQAQQKITNGMASTIGTVSNTISEVNKATSDLLKVTKKYYEALNAINSAITSMKQVEDCNETYTNIVKLYRDKYAKVSARLKEADSRKAYQKTLNNALSMSTKVLRQLDMFIKPGIFKMTDNERITRAESILEELNKNYTLLDSFIIMYAAKAAKESGYDGVDYTGGQ